MKEKEKTSKTKVVKDKTATDPQVLKDLRAAGYDTEKGDKPKPEDRSPI